MSIFQYTTRTETPFNPIDRHRRAHRSPSMVIATFSDGHRWDLIYHPAWEHLWSILGLNISNFNLLSFPFEPENHLFRSLALELFGTKLKNLAKLQLFA